MQLTPRWNSIRAYFWKIIFTTFWKAPIYTLLFYPRRVSLIMSRHSTLSTRTHNFSFHLARIRNWTFIQDFELRWKIISIRITKFSLRERTALSSTYYNLLQTQQRYFSFHRTEIGNWGVIVKFELKWKISRFE